MVRETFRTHELDFYRKLYQEEFRGDDKKIYTIFGVPISNAKETRKVQFHPSAPVIKYHQKSSNSCCLSSLASDFRCIKENMDLPALVKSIEKPLTLQTESCKNRIHFVNAIM